MSLEGIWGWDTANKDWVKLLVDSLGHAQVDVLTSALPSGAATLAKQTDQLTKLNSIITKLAGGLPAALDTLALKVREQGTPSVHLYGYDGSNWQTLRVQATAYKNLRVGIYKDDTIAQIFSAHADGLSNAVSGLVTASYLYGFNGTSWDRLRSNASQQLIVDNPDVETLLAGGLPAALDGLSLKVKEQSPITDYANYGQANIRNQLLSLSYTVLNTRLPSALDTDSLKIREQGTPSVHLYGYDGSNWQTLLVQSSAQKNLRVGIYQSGAQATVFSAQADALSNAAGGLATTSLLYGFNNSEWDRLRVQSSSYPHLEVCINESGQLVAVRQGNSDSSGVSVLGLVVNSRLHGFDGSNWERIRTYATGILKVGRAEVGLLTARMTGTGQVGATGARKLFWMLLNPSAGNSAVELTDAISTGQTVVADHFDTTRDGHMLTFDPPMEFSNGIYLETFTNMTSITFGYL